MEFLLLAKRLFTLASPIVVNALISQCARLATVIFVGRLPGPEFLGSAILGNMVCNISGYSLAFGMCSALDTLISQAFGAKEFRLMGLYSQRAMIILSISSLPVLFLWTKTSFILHHLLSIPEREAELSQIWTSTLALGLWPTLATGILGKFLQGQNIVWPVTLQSILSTAFQITLSYSLIFTFGLGFEGAALSIPLTQWFSFFVLLSIIGIRKKYIHFFKSWEGIHQSTKVLSPSSNVKKTRDNNFIHYSSLPSEGTDTDTDTNINKDRQKNKNSEESSFELESFADFEAHFTNHSSSSSCSSSSTSTDLYSSSSHKQDPTSTSLLSSEDNWPPLSSEVFQDWPQFLKLGVPGAISLFLEWGSFEFAASIAGQLGSTPLAAHGVLMSTSAIFYMLPLALASATSTIVGNSLGENQPKIAKQVVNLGLIFGLIYGVIAGVLLVGVLRPYWGAVYSSDPFVQQTVYRVLPVMIAYELVDSVKCIALNVLRSTGRPTLTVVGNTLSCVLVLLPIGYLWAIQWGYGLEGLWLAMSLGWLVASIAYLIVIFLTDWKSQIIVKNKSTDINIPSPIE